MSLFRKETPAIYRDIVQTPFLKIGPSLQQYSSICLRNFLLSVLIADNAFDQLICSQPLQSLRQQIRQLDSKHLNPHIQISPETPFSFELSALNFDPNFLSNLHICTLIREFIGVWVPGHRAFGLRGWLVDSPRPSSEPLLCRRSSRPL